ncbi:MAG: hypothetical protein ACOCXO_01400 [Bacteroidota bacterium]
MKTLANIFTAAIIFFSITIATAETTSFMMQTADDRFMEVVSKQECELDEEIPSHHLTVKEYIDLSIRILRMPKYIESTLDEEDFQKPADSPVKFYAKSEQMEISDFVKDENLLSAELASIDTEAVFNQIMKEENEKMLTADILNNFTKTEKEINEQLSLQFLSSTCIAK